MRKKKSNWKNKTRPYLIWTPTLERSKSAGDHKELFSLLGGAAGYLNQATAELKAAMQREKEGEFSSAIRGYRAAVDILITGVQGE